MEVTVWPRSLGLADRLAEPECRLAASRTDPNVGFLVDPTIRWRSPEGPLRVELGGSNSIERMTANGDEQKLTLLIGGFRFCPKPDLDLAGSEGRRGVASTRLKKSESP
jgi:hypothetical protein